MIIAKDLWKTYPGNIEVLKGVSLTVPIGKSLAIMGASGEGKTTLLHILGTLETPDKGSVEFGKPFGKEKLRQKYFGFVFQSYNLIEDMSALENVLLPAKITREYYNNQSFFINRAKELLDAVGLSSRIRSFAKELSGGEKQRSAIARALLNDPDFILADEPSGNLDHAQSEKIHELLFSCTKGKGLIIVTHDQELSSLCDEIMLLHRGNLTLLPRN